jgi:hypothetical protein
MSDNINGYHGAYETIITACTAALIMPVAGYDLYNHLMQLLTNSFWSVLSVIHAHAKQAIANHKAVEGFAGQPQGTGEFYINLFLILLERAQTLAPMVLTRVPAPLHKPHTTSFPGLVLPLCTTAVPSEHTPPVPGHGQIPQVQTLLAPWQMPLSSPRPGSLQVPSTAESVAFITQFT